MLIWTVWVHDRVRLTRLGQMKTISTAQGSSIVASCSLGIPLARHSHTFPSIKLRAGRGIFVPGGCPPPTRYVEHSHSSVRIANQCLTYGLLACDSNRCSPVLLRRHHSTLRKTSSRQGCQDNKTIIGAYVSSSHVFARLGVTQLDGDSILPDRSHPAAPSCGWTIAGGR